MIWLIGSGPMSEDYAKVLEAQKQNFLIVGRGKNSALAFEEKTGQSVITGGLENFLLTSPVSPSAAIVSVGIEQLYSTTIQLLNYGVKQLLVEKPGGLTSAEIEHIESLSKQAGANTYIAYNRRFYSSVLKAQELIEAEGGVRTFNFEVTEWSHVIEKLKKGDGVLSKWFLGNTTHVADLAFYLGGQPKEMSCFTSGSLSWHPSSSAFAGAGRTKAGVLFNYGADWESAGRWSVEVLTNENRYILRPMEALQVQKRGTIPILNVEIDNQLDEQFKPGLYCQVASFLDGDNSRLCGISEQKEMIKLYERMAGY